MPTVITIVGNTAGDPELRYTKNATACCSWTLVVNQRVKTDGQWTDGEPTFYRCTAWDQTAEHVAESVSKGDRLIVSGRFKTRSYETRDGEKRLSLDVDVDEVGAEMRFATLKIQRAQRSGGFRDGSQARPTGTDGIQTGGYDDPWGSAPPAGQPQPQEAPF